MRSKQTKLDILVFGAHPDDAELFTGGTLARMADMGYVTGVVDMTRGELGTRGTAATRRREAMEAARILGLTVRLNLGFPDGDIAVSPEARLKVIQVLREYRPQIVITHYWEDRHPDHVHASRLVAEAVHHAGLAKIRTRQKRFRPAALLFFKLPWNIAPSFVIDVSNYVLQRDTAIAAHRSQLFNPGSREPDTYLSRPGFLAQMDGLHSYYGAIVRKEKAEAFYLKEPLEIGDLVAQFPPSE